MQSITIRRPDDFHVHLRQGAMLRDVTIETARHFGRALVMPNTDPPVLNAGHVNAYREEILAAVPPGLSFEPLMTIKLTHATTPKIVRDARKAGAIAAKLYPEGVTTNSQEGVHDVRKLFPVLKAMEDCGMVLCVHGELPEAFCLQREREFLPKLDDIRRACPDLKMVLEHVTDAASLRWLDDRQDDNVAVTITVHHLLLTLDDVIGGSLKPHHFCKPVAKTNEDRLALLHAVLSGHAHCFLGTDSAPHAQAKKECAEGCAGIYSAPVALAALADIFDQNGLLHRLEYFTSTAGADFYGLPYNEGTVTLERRSFPVPRSYPGGVIPFLAGRTLPWKATD